MDRTPPPFDYLLTCSLSGLESFELSRLNRISNMRKQLHRLMEEWIEAEVDARLTHWLLESKRGAAPTLSVVVLPPVSNASVAQRTLPFLQIAAEALHRPVVYADARPKTSPHLAVSRPRIRGLRAPRYKPLAFLASPRTGAKHDDIALKRPSPFPTRGNVLGAVGEHEALRQLEFRARHRVCRTAQGNPARLIGVHPLDAPADCQYAFGQTRFLVPVRPRRRPLRPRPPARVLGGSELARDRREAKAG